MPNPEKSIKSLCLQGLAIRSGIQCPGSPVLSKRTDVQLITSGTGLIITHGVALVLESCFQMRGWTVGHLAASASVALNKGKDSAH